jgi:hypothetical protein
VVLSTLDERAELEALRFMPEMVAYCRCRLTIERRASKVCDTIT